jgi:hypothetical protein
MCYLRFRFLNTARSSLAVCTGWAVFEVLCWLQVCFADSAPYYRTFKPASAHSYFICLKARFWDTIPVALLAGHTTDGTAVH